MKRLFLSIMMMMLASACGDDTAAPESTPLSESGEAVESASTDPDPDPPFDFRRAVLEPEQQEARTRTCIVSSISRAAETDPGDPSDEPVVGAQLLRCWHPNGIYEVRALLVASAADLEVTPSPTPVSEAARRVSLELHGVDESGRRPIGIVRASRLVEMTLPPMAVPPVGGPVGFNFDLGPRRPASFGARQSCAIRAMSVVERVGPEQGLADVVVTMPVTCVHEDGRSQADLHFTEETLEHALVVAPGAVAHGTLEPPRTLRVLHVTPAERP